MALCLAASLRVQETPSRGQGIRQPPDLDYELAIDKQVEKLTDLRQKLTYFLITASTAIAAFVVNFYVKSIQGVTRYASHPPHGLLLFLAVASATSCSALALVSIHLSHRSFGLHLKYRYEYRGWSQLLPAEQGIWDRISRAALWTQTLSFVALALEVALFGLFLYPVFTAKFS